jgi:adenine deaminase
MMNYRCNRREFLSHSGAGIAGLVSGQWLGGATTAHAQGADVTPRDPDLVVFNAKVYTVDSRVPKAEAFAVKGGRFVAVGRSDEIKGLVGKKTQTYDARQMMIVPGFIDTHNHGRAVRCSSITCSSATPSMSSS